MPAPPQPEEFNCRASEYLMESIRQRAPEDIPPSPWEKDNTKMMLRKGTGEMRQ
jgi:hypothetical protein